MTKGWFIACCSGKSLGWLTHLYRLFTWSGTFFLIACLPLCLSSTNEILSLLTSSLTAWWWHFISFFSSFRFTVTSYKDWYILSVCSFLRRFLYKRKKVWSLCEPLPGVCKNSRDSSTIVCMNEGLRSLAGWSGRRHQRPFLWYRLPAIMTIILDVCRLREWRAKLS